MHYVKDDGFLDNYGTVDATIPSSNKRCCACGANFHCRVSSSFVTLKTYHVFSSLHLF